MIAFLHTSPVHVDTFARLMGQDAPDYPVEHLVDETLLRDAQAAGPDDAGIVARVSHQMHEAARNGAVVVVCTCSTIGGIAEKVETNGRFLPMRIDRAMADHAVETGSRILIVAALQSTVGPTQRLVEESAAASGRTVTIRTRVVHCAWAYFQHADPVAYHAAIERAIHAELDKAAPDDVEVVVLAQASMAPVANMFVGADVKVLSSPGLGVRKAIEAARGR